MDFDKIQHFLNSDKNSEIKEYYFDIATELNHIISIKRDNFEAFEEILFQLGIPCKCNAAMSIHASFHL